jgi:hypothetical protein
MRRLQLKLSQPRCQGDVKSLYHSLPRYAGAARKRRSQQ